MKHSRKLRSLIALGLCLLLSLSVLVSCASKPTDSRIKADTVIGTVDGKDVYYDELYFLVSNYLSSAEESQGGDTAKMREELDRLVQENITVNFAILKLCENVGLDYDDKEMEENAKTELQATINVSFDGDEELYEQNRLDYGLTERYLLFTYKVDLIYERLLTHYPQIGLVEDDSSALLSYIKENFVRTIHVANPDYSQISLAYDLIQNGKSLSYIIGETTYNKDFSDISGNGNYFCRGYMDEVYENAAFDLSVGEISGIVESQGELGNSYEVCYYIIQRLALDDDYITENFNTLQNQYYGVEIASDLEEVKKSLSFVPNDFYEDLDLTRLPEVYEAPSYLPVVIGIVIGGAVALVAAVVVIVLLKKKHAKKNVGVRRV